MHTDENKMNFLRRVLNTTPNITVRQAFTLLDAATESFPVDADNPGSVMWNGVCFTREADDLMLAGNKIAAIREVRDTNDSTLNGQRFGLKEQKEIVEARMKHLTGW